MTKAPKRWESIFTVQISGRIIIVQIRTGLIVHGQNAREALAPRVRRLPVCYELVGRIDSIRNPPIAPYNVFVVATIPLVMPVEEFPISPLPIG